MDSQWYSLYDEGVVNALFTGAEEGGPEEFPDPRPYIPFNSLSKGAGLESHRVLASFNKTIKVCGF